jgi:xylulokinase
MPRFLGVDVGSSSIKAAVLDTNEEQVASIRSRPFPAALPSDSTLNFEIDVETVTGHVLDLCEELAVEAGPVDGLVVCCQMGGLTLVAPDGKPLSRYYSWRDQRSMEPHPGGGGSYFDVYSSRLTEEDVTAIGRELRAGSTAVLLFWLAENGQLPKTTAYPVSLADAVTARLCGTAPATEATQALGMLDLRTGDWHPRLYEAAGAGDLPRARLISFDQPVGMFRCGGRDLPCYPGVGDQQAALLGIGLREGELSINASTGSQVSQLTEQLVLGDYQSRPFIGGRFLNTITHLPAGRSLNVIVDLLTELSRAEGASLSDPWDYIAKQAAVVPPEELGVDLAFFAGPMGDRGGISNIRTDNLTVGALFRAAFRDMAENYLACARRIAPRENWSEVLLSGGLPQKMRVLRDMISRRFAATLRDSTTTEETLMGLLTLARTIANR